MALIICKTCGKKVSDTAKACIHCGEPLMTLEVLPRDPIQKDNVERVIGPTNDSDTMVPFKSLGEAQREELVHAFWEADKVAMHYQKKKLILDHLKYWLWFPLAFAPLLTIGILLFAFRLKVQSPESLIFVLLLAVFGFVIFGFKALLFKIIEKITVNRKEKRLAYEKRFHIWAKTEKQIDYTPIFVKEVDKQMFEQINIDTFKL